MANYYEHNLGTTFGFEFSVVSGIIPETHSFRDLKLYPKNKPQISSPVVQTNYVEVPGRTGLLDLTETLTGDVRYFNRTGEFRFTQAGGRSQWDSTYHLLKAALHGKRKKILMDEEADGYYIGRLTVNAPEYNDKKGVAYFSVSANLEPYKRALWRSTEPWLWDNLNFETGYIPTPVSTVVASENTPAIIPYNGWRSSPADNLYGNTMPFVPNVIISDVGSPEEVVKIRMTYPTDEMVYPIDESTFAMGKTTDGWNTVVLNEGDNTEIAPDFIISDKAGFVGFDILENSCASARVTLDYRAGWL